MSHSDVRAIVDLRIDFIVQNTSASTLRCHYDDGWGPSSSDHTGQEGLQDCLMSRYQLCARHGDHTNDWFDFTACVFRNQGPADVITDGMKKFNLTVEYCAAVTGHSVRQLKECAESERGERLLAASHEVDVKLNHHVDDKGHRHPDWIIIDGKDYGLPKQDYNWLALVCQAYRGATMPASCKE